VAATNADGASVKLTATEELILEVLASRYREGDHLWTFRKSLSRQLGRLADMGLVDVMSGIVEGTVRASFTDAGIAASLDPAYSKPITRRIDVNVEVSTDEIKAVLWHVSNSPRVDCPRDPYVERWLHLLATATSLHDEEKTSHIVAAMPTGLAWAYFEARAEGGEERLRQLLAANPG